MMLLTWERDWGCFINFFYVASVNDYQIKTADGNGGVFALIRRHKLYTKVQTGCGGSGTVFDVPSSSDNNIKSVRIIGRYSFKYSPQ